MLVIIFCPTTYLDKVKLKSNAYTVKVKSNAYTDKVKSKSNAYTVKIKNNSTMLVISGQT